MLRVERWLGDESIRGQPLQSVVGCGMVAADAAFRGQSLTKGENHG
jgi:hypothetical protein